MTTNVKRRGHHRANVVWHQGERLVFLAIRSTRPFNVTKLAIVTGVLAAAATLAAVPAHADTASFLDAVHDSGFVGTANGDATLVRNGSLVCEAVQNTKPRTVARALYYAMPSLDSVGDAEEFVALSIIHLCPPSF